MAAAGGVARGPVTPAAILALQRSAGNQAVSRLLAEDQHGAGGLLEDAMSSPGLPPAGPVRAELESYYQNDFSAARIHDNPSAHRAAAAMGAEAMTIGTDVFLGAGAAARRDVLGHEFSHVDANLKGIPETGRDSGTGITVTDPRQPSERAAAAAGTAFAAGAAKVPSAITQRALEVEYPHPEDNGAASAPSIIAQRAPTVYMPDGGGRMDRRQLRSSA
jgi:hypothetical protein